MCAKLLQSCPTLCNPMDCSLPGSSVHGILQAKILEWVAMISSRGLPNPGIKPTSLMSPALAGEFSTTRATREAYIYIYFGICPQFLAQSSYNLGISWAIGNVLGWPKGSFGFFITSDRKTWMNFLANSIFCYSWYSYQALSITLAFMLMRWPRMGVLDSFRMGWVIRNSD